MQAAKPRSRTGVLSLVSDGIPLELRVRSQWVVWRLVLRDGRWTKVPFDPVGMHPARTNDSHTWRSFELALERYERGNVDGVGFVFSKDDPYAGIDLDGCRDPVGGDIAPWAAHVLERLNSYAEVSPSGTGVKVVVRGQLPCEGTGRRRRARKTKGTGGKAAEIEAYHFGRFFALTGCRSQSGDATLNSLISGIVSSARLCAEETMAVHAPCRVFRRSLVRTRSCLTAPAKQGTALYSAGCSMPAPWMCITVTIRALILPCAACWPSGPIATPRIDRLFRRSTLMRPKWDERHAADGATYGEMTIRKTLR